MLRSVLFDMLSGYLELVLKKVLPPIYTDLANWCNCTCFYTYAPRSLLFLLLNPLVTKTWIKHKHRFWHTVLTM